MPLFTNIELTDIVLVYGAAGENSRQAQILYRERFPNRRIPDCRTFISTVQHLRDHGKFESVNADRGRTRTQRTLAAEEEILEAVENRPQLSCRRLGLEIGVSSFVVWRTLKEQGLHPYHIQKVQALYPGDEEKRVEFCEWMIQKCVDIPDFLKILLYTDEASFTRDGVFNMHNTHIWSDENPHAIRETGHQRKFSINVWAGIIDQYLIGPYVLPNRLNGPGYLHFLEDILPVLLEEIPLQLRQRMWYLLDGAPPHFDLNVRQFLNIRFPQKWIGRNGPTKWPPRSPDLNPCDFFLWGHMKQLVYNEPINSVEQLTNKVNAVAEELRQNPRLISNVQSSLERRLQVCVNNNGRHFEQLL